MTIGDRVKIRRNELQLTQRDLAKKMGYSNHTVITKIEAGQVDLPLSRVEQIAAALDTSVAYLMGWQFEQSPEELAGLTAKILKDPELLQFTEQYFALPESERSLVLSLMKKLKKED